MSGIILGPSDCDELREKRTKEALSIWKKLVETKGFKETSPVLINSIDIFREALNNYQNGGYLATLVTCRAVAESLIYNLALIKNFVVINNMLMPNENNEEIIKLQTEISSQKNTRLIKRLNDLLSQKFREHGYETKEIRDLIDEIREEGNYAAHIAETAHRKELEYIMKIFSENENSEPFFQGWPDKERAFKQLKRTQELISLVIKNLYNKHLEKQA